MTERMKRRTERKRSFRPWLEVLENRWCPTVTVSVLDGHILQVLGDRSDNVIDIETHGGLISARADDAPMQTFSGIDTVRVNTYGGDDTVRVQFEPNTPLPGLSVRLGAGNDHFILRATLASPLGDTPPPAPDRIPGRMMVAGGAGDDKFDVVLDVPPGPCRTFQPSLALHINGGAGRDTINTLIGDTSSNPDYINPVLVKTRLDLGYEGGQGADTFSTHFVNVDLELPAVQRIDGGEDNDTIENTYTGTVLDAPLALTQNGGEGADTIENTWAGDVIRAPLAVTQNGGAGSDTLITTVSNSALDVGVTLNTDGGAGDDSASLEVVDATVKGALDAMADLGAGNDAFTLSTQNLLVEGTTSVKVHLGDGSDHMGFNNHDVTVDGTFALDVAGGSGNDAIEVDVEPLILAGGLYRLQISGDGGDDIMTEVLLPAVQRGGTFTTVLDGGDGRDTLIGFYEDPNLMPGGLVDVSFLGGKGNDFISMQVDMAGFTPESGRLRLAVDGGAGSDHATFLVRGAVAPMENALFTLDGGAGEDFAIVSALVHAKNCEHVEIV